MLPIYNKSHLKKKKTKDDTLYRVVKKKITILIVTKARIIETN